eukprot:gene5838-8940_t
MGCGQSHPPPSESTPAGTHEHPAHLYKATEDRRESHGVFVPEPSPRYRKLRQLKHTISSKIVLASERAEFLGDTIGAIQYGPASDKLVARVEAWMEGLPTGSPLRSPRGSFIPMDDSSKCSDSVYWEQEDLVDARPDLSVPGAIPRALVSEEHLKLYQRWLLDDKNPAPSKRKKSFAGKGWHNSKNAESSTRKAEEPLYITGSEYGDTIFYNLWGVDSSDSRHKWILTADASGGYQYTNEATHQVLVELPDVPQNERPLSVSEKHRLMLRAFYETFQESQIAEVPKLIFYYHENEEKLFMDLFKIFDPEAWPLHYQLLDLYAEKAPEKIGNIPQALAQYKGREAELLGKLANLYTGGVPLRMPPPLPPTPEGYKQRLTAFYEKTSPEQIPHVDNILAAHAANYDELMEKLAGQCPEYAHLLLPGEPERVSEVASPDPANAASPEPVQDVTKSPYYRQVYEFYSQHNPAKLTSLTEVLQAYAGREEDLIKALHGRYDQPYSPEESERTRQRLAQQGDNDFLSVSRCRSSGLVAGQGIWYDKVYNFYVEHNPKRLSSIGTVLRMYEGREKELMKDLHERYNLPFSEDEPASSAASPQLEPPPPSNPPPAGNSHPEASSRNYRHEVT